MLNKIWIDITGALTLGRGVALMPEEAARAIHRGEFVPAAQERLG